MRWFQFSSITLSSTAVAGATVTNPSIFGLVMRRAGRVSAGAGEHGSKKPKRVSGPDLLFLTTRQGAKDRINGKYAPNLNARFEDLPGPINRIDVGEFIASSSYSTVFGLETPVGTDELVIKYQGDCDHEEGKVHRLMLDFWFAQAASVIGLSPKPLFISPAVSMADYCMEASHCRGHRDSGIEMRGAGVLDKLQFNIFNRDSKAATECRKGGMVRYMAMERVGDCLNMYGTSGLDLGDSVRVGIRVIELLERLHNEAGVIHGDIHSGNVCRRSATTADPFDFVFIDFGMASAVGHEGEGDSERSAFPPHYSLTPWQLVGYGFNRRDDVFKAVYMVAVLMFGDDLSERLHSSCLVASGKSEPKYGQCLLDFKESGAYFTRIDSLFAGTDARVDQLGSAFMRVHELVMTMTEVEAEIPYTRIIDGFNEVLRVIESV